MSRRSTTEGRSISNTNNSKVYPDIDSDSSAEAEVVAPRNVNMVDSRVVDAQAAVDVASNDAEFRTVAFDGNPAVRPPVFCDNSIKTSKYNVLSFLPISLLEQFRRQGNQYFLLMSVLMLLGTYTTLFQSPIQPWTTLGPLIVVLSISLAQEGYADYKRHKADDEVNNRLARVSNVPENDPKVPQVDAATRARESSGPRAHRRHSGELPGFAGATLKWREVRAGHLLVLRNGDQLPADVLLLATSEAEGLGYIETSQIDGETNLKLRRSGLPLGKGALPEWTAEASPEAFLSETLAALKNVKGAVVGELPNANINTYTGNLKLGGGAEDLPLSNENVMLRGSSLRNTAWAVGLVVFTGRDTKVVLNSRAAPSKLSEIDRAINRAIQIIFLADILLSLLSTALMLSWESSNFDSLAYVGYGDDATAREASADEGLPYWSSMDWQEGSLNFGKGFLTFIVLYNNFIPISMYVTVEIVVFVLLYYVNSDLSMYHAETDTPAKARSSNITDLGQIQYIFSDKTGTLTQNVMRFKRCSVAGRVFGAPLDGGEGGPAWERLENLGTAVERAAGAPPSTGAGAKAPPAPSPEEDFLKILCLCNTVVVEKDKDGRLQADGVTPVFVYQAESPDEAALVEAARDTFGFELLGRTTGDITFRVGQETFAYEVLATNKFDSYRKRMSIVLRDPAAGRRWLLCKGADTAMLGEGCVAADQDAARLEKLQDHLNTFAAEGLRTLVCGVRELDSKLWAEWEKTYHAALTTLGAGRDEAVTMAADQIEKSMKIVGATAIEDKLQDGVPDTIADLARAGIKLWVLTGDKKQTAINIGFSCKVLRPNMNLQVIEAGEEAYVRQQLVHLFRQFVGEARLPEYRADALKKALSGGLYAPAHLGRGAAVAQHLGNPAYRMTEAEAAAWRRGAGAGEAGGAAGPGAELALVLEGPGLIHVLGDDALEWMLFQVASLCNTVIACRVSPKQKALLVGMVKKYISPTPVTLAIGDGANDVNMIQEAQVGVGISGNEGQQAVNSSDFAIAQFRYLKPLLLVHGRWNYRRLSKVVLYSLCKNMVLVETLFFFGAWAGFSGTALYDQYLIALFNFFLGLPIIAVGVFDQDITREEALEHPSAYSIGMYNKDLSVIQILRWIATALINGALVFWLSYGCFSGAGVHNGHGLATWGTLMFSVLVITMNWKVLLEHKSVVFCGCPCREQDENQQPKSWKSCCSTFGWSLFFLIFSILFYFFVVLFYSVVNNFEPANYYGVGTQTLGLPLQWLYLLLIPTLAVVIEVTFLYLNDERVSAAFVHERETKGQA